jgi:hypothetical protein
MTTNATMNVIIKSWTFWPSEETTNSKPHGPIIMKKTIRSYLLHFSLAIA